MGVDHKTLTAAQILWDYLRLREPIGLADVIICMGSNDDNVPVHGAALWRQGYAPWLIMSGGIAHADDLAGTGWDRTEAEVFAERAMRCGVPASAILLEPNATNTGENFRLSRPIIEPLLGRKLKSAVVVCRPHMMRRGRATAEVAWSDVQIAVSAEEIGLSTYLDRLFDPGRFLNQMVGDFQRVLEYPDLGYQTLQVVPDQVLHAQEYLKTVGFDLRLP